MNRVFDYFSIEKTFETSDIGGLSNGEVPPAKPQRV